ncbi:hypothetical protein DPEC_G00185790 [Dallia pectoralis]|uniref:Uncharacterized protein n=1 Tax=Dallia pectoralis TaxID=75939 RepID=A0ACC2GBQ5_DALPE|nr:hypothetical protein DPEC_G00185790 [Dallia pectoralis]
MRQKRRVTDEVQVAKLNRSVLGVASLHQSSCFHRPGPSSERVSVCSSAVAAKHAGSMEVKEHRPYCSLTKSRRDKERRYTGSSGDSEECGGGGGPGSRVPTQKSYSSSETLKAFDHQDSSRLLYGSRVKEMVHRQQEEYSQQANKAYLIQGLSGVGGSVHRTLDKEAFGRISTIHLPLVECDRMPVVGQNFNLRQLGICEPATRRGLAFCAEMGLPHRGYSIGAGSDADTENDGVMSPERAMRLWGRGVKSGGRSSCLSSRSNSALTLTDTEHENKSDSENGKSPPRLSVPVLILRLFAVTRATFVTREPSPLEGRGVPFGSEGRGVTGGRET